MQDRCGADEGKERDAGRLLNTFSKLTSIISVLAAGQVTPFLIKEAPMRRALLTIGVAAVLTGCAGHITKPEDNWRGEHDDRSGALAVNLVHAPAAGVKCAVAGLFSFVGVVLTFGDGYEEASRIMHSNCNAEDFTVSSKDIREGVPLPVSQSSN